MWKRKPNRVVYRLWHNRSSKGRVGYIGKDKYYPRRLNLCRRKKDEGCKKLYAALNKYPLSVWRIEILARGFKKDKTLNEAERFYINKFESRHRGYNITKGGEGGPGWHKGRKLATKTKEKLSRANSGQNHPKWGKKDSFETRMKKSAAAKGNKGNLGRRFSEQHKTGIAAAQKAAWDGYTIEQRKKRGMAMSRGWARRRVRLQKTNAGRPEFRT
jgi:group I intron endonuclease